ncbi:hypothetical protein AMAG_19192 [Allomyces macrogynus ATCC 38327]|uniref:Uncharacterized protein n=1 Tax=Allomyces macrogynus (strain ATCC 38327) TaxID=578462 RepID=A0A0L0STN0_ALLM3|nr:hypothetical protein AMAG_19192 [Allomyces macrogynus ATCC 38327]|eukprot:KNE65674.1 hypothetical protein AMAG_19192 [Allomyces macrogynus ATCC 38327]
MLVCPHTAILLDCLFTVLPICSYTVLHVLAHHVASYVEPDLDKRRVSRPSRRSRLYCCICSSDSLFYCFYLHALPLLHPSPLHVAPFAALDCRCLVPTALPVLTLRVHGPKPNPKTPRKLEIAR